MVALHEQFHPNGTPSRLQGTGYGLQRDGETVDVCNLHGPRTTDQNFGSSDGLFIDPCSLIFERSAGANEIIFCGYRYDPEAELYYVRNRSCNAALGRWLQRDPIGYQGGVSLYEYVKSMVERNADPSGLRAELPGVQPPVLSKTGRRHPLSDGRYYQNFHYTQALGVVITSGDTPSNQKFFQLAESLLHGLTKLSGVGEILTDMAKSITDNGDYQIPFLGTAFPEVTKVVFCKTGKVQSVTLKEWRNTQWEWDTSLHGQMGGGFVLSGGEDQDREFFKSLLDTLKELVKSAGGE